jgi:hypothetical protein
MLMVRDPKEVVLHYDTLHHGKMLFQQYVVDQAVKMQDNRLQYLASSAGQQQIRADTYNSLQDAIRNEAGHQRVGRAIILPSTFPGGPRYMREKYQDAMAIVRDKGSPSYFITMTTNPNWEEITTALKPRQTASDRPDIVARVFNIKLKEMLHDLIKRNVLGIVIGYTWVVEYQKRGLPHVHILLILESRCRPMSPDDYDIITSAELPSRETNPQLYAIVSKQNVHTCSPGRCLDADGICSKKFPKPYCIASEEGEDNYPTYRRRSLAQGGNDTNKFVVPYNPWLTFKYNCHINVELASSIKSKFCLAFI